MPGYVGSMFDVKRAIYTVARADQGLQQRLTPPSAPGQPAAAMQFYLGRDPLPAVISDRTASVSLVGETAVPAPAGAKEEMTFTFNVVSLSHDLCAQVHQDLDRLFHTATRGVWKVLPMPAGTGIARIRRESTSELPEPDGETYRLLPRYRVLYAPPVLVAS